jgi:hypothetical protein
LHPLLFFFHLNEGLKGEAVRQQQRGANEDGEEGPKGMEKAAQLDEAPPRKKRTGGLHQPSAIDGSMDWAGLSE